MSEETINIMDYQKLIYEVCWSFNRSTGVEWEELVSESYFILTKRMKNYKKEKADFSTFLYTTLRNHLSNFILKQKKLNGGGFIKVALNEYNGSTPSLEERLIFLQSLKELPNDARTVCALILDAPYEYLKENSPRQCQINLRKKLTTMGWAHKRIMDCFKVIKNELHGEPQYA